MIIPTSLSVRAGLNGPACSFTVALAYAHPPTKGDKLLISIPVYGQVGVSVSEIYHFVSADDPVCLVVADSILTETYDGMLSVLDWFKANYQIEDIKADSEPQSYYKFYRSLIHIMGLSKVVAPTVGYDPVSIKVFAECCRAIVVAETKPTKDEFVPLVNSLNPTIQHLHAIVLSKKLEEPDGANMLMVVKQWERLLNQKQLMRWAAEVDSCVESAVAIFSRLPSIPVDKLPVTLRQE